MDEFFKCCESSEDQVSYLSKRRIPFELEKKKNKEELKYFRSELKKKIEALKLTSSKILCSEFFSKEEEYFDVENILIYNIGKESFSNSSKNGLIFNYPTDKFNNPSFNNKYTYKIIEQQELDAKLMNLLLPERERVRIDFTLEESGDKENISKLWYLIKTGDIKKINQVTGGFIGIDVEVGTGIIIRNFACQIKKMIDSIFISLHYDNFFTEKKLDNLIQKIGNRNIKRASIEKLLINNEKAIFGYRENLIQIYKENSIKWNPKDELCRFFRILRKENSDKADKSISVTVYEFDKIESLL